MCFSLVNGEYHRITDFFPDRWCMHADERNGPERRISGKSVAGVKLRFNAPPLYLCNGITEFPGDSGVALRLACMLFRERFVVASLIHSTSEPMAEWLSCKMVFTISSSPHTMILAKRL